MRGEILTMKRLTPSDWKKIWDEIKDKEYVQVDCKFQDDMNKRHGKGSYYMDNEHYWKYKQAFIQRVVNKWVKEKNA